MNETGVELESRSSKGLMMIIDYIPNEKTQLFRRWREQPEIVSNRGLA